MSNTDHIIAFIRDEKALSRSMSKLSRKINRNDSFVSNVLDRIKNNQNIDTKTWNDILLISPLLVLALQEGWVKPYKNIGRKRTFSSKQLCHRCNVGRVLTVKMNTNNVLLNDSSRREFQDYTRNY